MIDKKKPTMICGDFNICAEREKTNGVTVMLEKLGFKQLVTDATHIEGGHIDHCYWLDGRGECKLPTLEKYSPYWTDHDAILETLKRK